MLPNLKMKKKWKNMTSIMKIQLSYQKRQNFKNLDTVFNEDNYAVLPSRDSREFQYSGAKETINITRDSVSHQNAQRIIAGNACKNVQGPRGAVKYEKTPVESFILLFTKSVIKNIVCYTNTMFQPAIERFPYLFEQSKKYPHFRLIGQLYFEAFTGICTFGQLLE